jgi:hypothetical protein
MVIVQRQPKLLEFVRATRPPGRLPGGLHGRQQQRDQNANDRNDHEQLYQGKAAPATATHATSPQNREQKSGTRQPSAIAEEQRLELGASIAFSKPHGQPELWEVALHRHELAPTRRVAVEVAVV